MSISVQKIEAWAVGVIERTKNHKRVEDARIEIKREWPGDHAKCARQIAGHANSSFGSDILWIIGLDEAKGVVGVEPPDLADWWAAVTSHFDGGICPSLKDVIVPVDGKTLMCLHLETQRAPYVIRNPAYNTPKGGPVELEVPWRDGTRTRTATRNDLLRMLVPTLAQPAVEILDGRGQLTTNKQHSYPSNSASELILGFHISIYIYPRSEQTVVIPFHRCRCILSDPGGRNSMDEFQLIMQPPRLSHAGRSGTFLDTHTIMHTTSELIVKGAGRCNLDANLCISSEPEWFQAERLLLRIVLSVIDSGLDVDLSISLKQDQAGDGKMKQWTVDKTA
jgi:hypothetical protein